MEGGFSFRNLRTFNSLRNPVFRLFFMASLAQMAAMNMQMFSRSLLVYRLTESATLLGLIGVAFGAPMFLVSLYGGVIADRFEKKYIIIAGYAAAGVMALVIAITLAIGYVTAENPSSWWVLFLASAGQGAIMGIMMPARQAIIPEIVGEEQLLNAISLRTFGMNFNRLVMPAVAGYFISLFDFATIFFTMAGLYVVGILLMYRMPRTGTMNIERVERGSTLSQIKDGISYLRHNRTILVVLGYSLFSVMLSMPLIRLLPMWEDILSIDAAGLGLLMSFSGIGALVGSLVLASLPNKKRGLLLLVGGIVSGVALISFSFAGFWFPASAFAVAAASIFFVGIGQTARMSLGNTLVQYYSEPDYRGRVMSFFMMNISLTQFSTLLVAMMADQTGGEWAVGVLAIALLVFSFLALLSLPRIRRLD
jgi:MFS family permease